MSVPVLKPFEKWKNLFESGKLRQAMEQAREAWATTTNETKCSEVRRPSGSELRNSRPGAQIIIFNEVIMKILILSDLHAHNDVLDKMIPYFDEFYYPHKNIFYKIIKYHWQIHKNRIYYVYTNNGGVLYDNNHSEVGQ